MKKKYLLIMVLSLVAIVNATYLSQKAYYFQKLESYTGTSVCDINDTVSCSIVLQSSYSKVFGVPFPYIALAVYPVILIIAFLGMRRNSLMPIKIISVLSLMGMLFNFFIMYREIIFVKAFCILCFICTLIIISIFTLSRLMIKKQN
jgi:uncharacterized membrane protein